MFVLIHPSLPVQRYIDRLATATINKIKGTIAAWAPKNRYVHHRATGDITVITGGVSHCMHACRPAKGDVQEVGAAARYSVRGLPAGHGLRRYARVVLQRGTPAPCRDGPQARLTLFVPFRTPAMCILSLHACSEECTCHNLQCRPCWRLSSGCQHLP